MFYKFIFYFLISVALNTLWDFSFNFILMSFITVSMSFMILYVLYIKDIGFYMSFIYRTYVFYAAFALSIVILSFQAQDNLAFNFGTDLYETRGEVINLTIKDNISVVSLKTKSLTNLSTNQQVLQYPVYINMAVSPLESYKLYDQIIIIGEIRNTNKINIIEKHNNESVVSRNDFQSLLLNTKYQITNIKKVNLERASQIDLSYWKKVKQAFYETSATLKSKIDNYMQLPFLGIAKGITFGSQENLSKEVKMSFIDSGLIHIMVLSGANVSFIILILFYILNLFPKISTRFKIFTTVLFSTLFIFATGLTSPSVRAGVMVNSNILSEYFSRNFNIKNSIFLSLFILTLINPLALLYSPSLHLSYLAIFGLVFVAIKIEYRFGKILALFLGILISVGPYLIALSGKINLLGIVISMLLEPVIILITILTFLITIISFVSTFLATILGILNSFLVSIILNSAEFLAHEIFIVNTEINTTLIKIYYFCFILWVIYQENEKN